jgi:hypothetical protein
MQATDSALPFFHPASREHSSLLGEGMPVRARLRVEHPLVAEMFAMRGITVTLSHRSAGYWGAYTETLYLQVGGENVRLEFTGQPENGPVTVTSIAGSARAIAMLREDGVLAADADPA